MTTFERCEEEWLTQRESGFSDSEIADLEKSMREDGCPKWYREDGKTIFCEGDFEEEVTNDILVCKKCKTMFSLIEILEDRHCDIDI